MARFINMTPHDITLVNDKGEIIRTFPKSGKEIRVEQSKTLNKVLDDIEIYDVVKNSKIINLPDYQEGPYYLVSSIVALSIYNREDLLVPMDFYRDENGKILGCKSLGRYNL